MRIRSIKPEFWSSEDIAALDWPTRLLFIGLWSYVDDNGVGRDNEKLIMADLFPLEDDPRETLATVSRGLQALCDGGQITRYEVDGRAYLYINAWASHQRIDRPNKPRYPLPTSENANVRQTLATSSRDPRETPATGAGEQGNRGTEEQSATRTRRRPSTPLPKRWQPNDKHKKYAHSKGINVDHEAERFRNWAQAKDQRYVDWDAAFRNWLTNSRTTGPTRPATSPRDQLPW